jgi:hypothetical protein
VYRGTVDKTEIGSPDCFERLSVAAALSAVAVEIYLSKNI